MHRVGTLKRLNAASLLNVRCRPGDLAVVVVADNKINLGLIVRVIRADDGTGDIHFSGEGHVWLIECAQPLMWTVGKECFMRKYGPAPDRQLQPIRGEPLTKRISSDLKLKVPRAKEADHV